MPRLQQQVDLLDGIRRRTGLSLEELARRVAIQPETMRKISKGYQKASDQLLAALRNLELYQRSVKSPSVVDPVSDATADGQIVRLGEKTSRQVPVVSWARAGSASDYADLCNQIDEWVATDCRDPNAFALILEGDSMEPEFVAGDVVVFAANSEPRNGDYVVCRLKEGYGVLFKRFRRIGLEGQTVKLESLNPAYKPLEYPTAHFQFIYPAVDLRRKLRR